MLFSIIIPVYNAKRFLHKCLESILQQTCYDWECVCIDDGSTDGSDSELEHFASLDRRIRVVRQNNQGVSSARNNGLRVAVGEWVVFCDADDYLPNDFLECMERLMIRYQNADLFMLRPILIDMNGLLLNETRQVKYQQVREFSGAVLDAVCAENDRWSMFTPWAKAFKKSQIISKKLCFNEALTRGEDSLFVAEYLAFSKKFIVDFAQTGYFYRQVTGSLSRQETADSLMKEVFGIRYLKYRQCRECPQAEMQLKRFCARRCLSLISHFRNKNLRQSVKRDFACSLVDNSNFRADVLFPIILWSGQIKFRIVAAALFLTPKFIVRRLFLQF